MHQIFSENYSKWEDLRIEISKIESNKEKGDIFEEFAYFYFQYFKDLYQIKELYFPEVDKKAFPKKILDKLKLETSDFGVDGVYITHNDEYIAVQVKFRSDKKKLNYDDDGLATFWSESEYADGRLIYTNCYEVTRLANKKKGHLLINGLILEQLELDFFNALKAFFNDSTQIKKKSKKIPRPYQHEILENINKGFLTHSRGKLIAACGIGKTMIALWLAEQEQFKDILFLAPSLQLIRQTLGEWAVEAKEPFNYLCVCSDETVDIEDQAIQCETDISVTTDVEEIIKFVKSSPQFGKKIIFSTYQSVPVLAEAYQKMGVLKFDLALFDEAHRTAGSKSTNLFSMALDDNNIFVEKRLFMTATERLITPRIKNVASDLGHIVFSMDDENIYGPVFHKLTFGEAIKKNIICDYKIIFAGISNNEMREIISHNSYVKEDVTSVLSDTLDIESLYKRILLKKVFQEFSIKKMVTFHSKIREAKQFAESLSNYLWNGENEYIAIHHINGSMKSSQRSYLISDFETADLGILTNVRCLTEGVDIPLIDAVYFANSKQSLVDIIQAVGRALRQPYGQKGNMAYIVIPLLVDDIEEFNLTDEGFETLFNVIQSLRDEDPDLAEWIDGLNFSAVKGKFRKSKGSDKLHILLPKELDFDLFERNLYLKIADVNRNPKNYISIGSKLGKSERKSNYTRVFKTICDYNPTVLYSSLIRPTLDLIEDSNLYNELLTSDLKINNNNISHCHRLGVIKKIDSKRSQLTSLGMKLKKNEISFKDLYINQIFLYNIEVNGCKFYPYREALKYLLKVRGIGFIEFVYGLYSIQVDKEQGVLFDQAIEISDYIKENFPNIEITSEVNRNKVLDELNELSPVSFSYKEVWTDRTTIGNQYRYLSNDFNFIEGIVELRNKRLCLKEGIDSIIENYLRMSEPYLTEEYGEAYWISEMVRSNEKG